MSQKITLRSTWDWWIKFQLRANRPRNQRWISQKSRKWQRAILPWKCIVVCKTWYVPCSKEGERWEWRGKMIFFLLLTLMRGSRECYIASTEGNTLWKTRPCLNVCKTSCVLFEAKSNILAHVLFELKASNEKLKWRVILKTSREQNELWLSNWSNQQIVGIFPVTFLFKTGP